MGCLTTYGIGSAPPFYGTGYVPQVCAARRQASAWLPQLWPGRTAAPAWQGAWWAELSLPNLPAPPSCPQAKWYQWGFLFSVLYLAVWVFVGGAWWKAIGIF